MIRRGSRQLLAVLTALCWLAPAAAALDAQRLSGEDLALLSGAMARLVPLIDARKQQGTACLLTWDELYAPLDEPQRAFLDAFRKLRGAELGSTAHYFGDSAGGANLVPVGSQHTLKDGERVPIDTQFLPRPVAEAYERMMRAMERELGRRLLVESGYRSPAYQLYLFLYYLPNHDHSIRETNRFVALPGHSEHGNPARQAIDFINEAGVNGEDHPEEFEALPEYRWLTERAGDFGFALSYPRDNAYNTAFEPWHWHYRGPAAEP
ncbi:MAG TPA: D-alanyl-D-alanine carboxypeptidase family protein [bacterium]